MVCNVKSAVCLFITGKRVDFQRMILRIVIVVALHITRNQMALNISLIQYGTSSSLKISKLDKQA